MNLLAQHGPCVCVHSVQEKSVTTQTEKPKSQDGGVCVNSHTLTDLVSVSSSSIVASQSASSRVSAQRHTTSTLLALCRVVDNA